MKGEEIKALRLRLGLTQTELAAEIGVHQVSVARWETGGITPMPIVTTGPGRSGHSTQSSAGQG